MCVIYDDDATSSRRDRRRVGPPPSRRRQYCYQHAAVARRRHPPRRPTATRGTSVRELHTSRPGRTRRPLCCRGSLRGRCRIRAAARAPSRQASRCPPRSACQACASRQPSRSAASRQYIPVGRALHTVVGIVSSSWTGRHPPHPQRAARQRRARADLAPAHGRSECEEALSDIPTVLPGRMRAAEINAGGACFSVGRTCSVASGTSSVCGSRAFSNARSTSASRRCACVLGQFAAPRDHAATAGRSRRHAHHPLEATDAMAGFQRRVRRQVPPPPHATWQAATAVPRLAS